jgi:hypothetical protein
MPELMKRTGSGHREIDGNKVESWYIVKHRDDSDPKSKDEIRVFTLDEEAELTCLSQLERVLPG